MFNIKNSKINKKSRKSRENIFFLFSYIFFKFSQAEMFIKIYPRLYVYYLSYFKCSFPVSNN